MEVAETQAIYKRYQPHLTDMATIVFSAQDGISANIYDDVVKLFGHNEYLSEVVELTPKTIRKYQANNTKFSPSRSEIMLKMVAMYKLGVEIFGNRDSFLNWLEKPAYGVAGRVPLQLVKTSDGIDLITDELYRIQHGDTA